jgi:hypothetical protein
VRISNFKFPISSEFLIPNKFEKINLGERLKFEEVIKTACLLTGWYSTKARGKKIKFILNLKKIK